MAAWNGRGVVGRATRVMLRYPLPRDEGELVRLRRESWEFLRPWEPRMPDGIDPCGREWFRRVLLTARREDSQRLLVCRAKDARVLGVFSLTQIVQGPFQSAFVGYWIGSSYARQGYMSEAFPLLFAHAFGRLGLHRIEANIRPENTASIALARRAGLRREGYSPRFLRIDGDWRDHERWALLADEWSADGPRAVGVQ